MSCAYHRHSTKRTRTSERVRHKARQSLQFNLNKYEFQMFTNSHSFKRFLNGSCVFKKCPRRTVCLLVFSLVDYESKKSLLPIILANIYQVYTLEM